MTDINANWMTKALYELCLEIEQLPASEQQTKVSMMASALCRKAARPHLAEIADALEKKAQAEKTWRDFESSGGYATAGRGLPPPPEVDMSDQIACSICRGIHAEFLKDDESVRACIERNRHDVTTLMSLLGRAILRAERAEATLAGFDHPELLKARADVLERALRNCFQLARRMFVSVGTVNTVQWGHIMRFCRDVGMDEAGVLRQKRGLDDGPPLKLDGSADA